MTALVKALDHSAVGRFWAEALGWSVFTGATAYVGPGGGFVAVRESKTRAKNRVHLDLATTSAAHQAELVTRLQALGAALADPEGHEFCVLAPS